jgi:hypothetical protein
MGTFIAVVVLEWLIAFAKIGRLFTSVKRKNLMD